jgi:hypothetical protein
MTEPQRHGAAPSRLLGRVCNLLLWLLLLAPAAPAQSLPATFSKVGPDLYQLTLGPNPAYYFGFEETEDLLLSWIPEKLDLGGPGGAAYTFTAQPTFPRRFFRARGISVSAPEDQDGDLIDDVWELGHALNPLNSNDANSASTESDALPGENNLAYYRRKRGINAQKEALSREVTTFNFGAAISLGEAISRPVSVFNGESLPFGVQEVYSREVSAFNFGGALATFESVGREVSVFNFGAPLAQFEAISRSVSVFNGESISTGFPEVYSREVSAFNFGGPTAALEAVSREVSVRNTLQ